MDIAAHDLTETLLCKVPGCPDEAVERRGRYALLCARHTEAKRREGIAKPGLSLVEGSAESEAKQLVTLGRALDKARAKLAAQRKGLRPAETALEAAESAWHDALSRLTKS